MNSKQQRVPKPEAEPSARFAKGGRGERIDFTSQETPFGWMIVGTTKRGLCWLALAGTKAEAEGTLREEFPAAELRRDPSLAGIVDAALATVGHPTVITGPAVLTKEPTPKKICISDATKLKRAKSEQLAAPQVLLDLRGTEFQLRVWQALRQIPRGETRSYSQLARELGSPNATRAVARACAMNRVAVVVPCHRVVGVSGALTGYRWGVERKQRFLEAEGRRSARPAKRWLPPTE
jgi:AraC family transcriptional regulator of adaptative response/methylated-DNA-[protein]-cysteine methyltransferase